jgi:hypothetical protein
MSKSTEDFRTKARRIDAGFGPCFEKISRFIWPWQEAWLLAVVGSLSFFDFLSTLTLLKLSGKSGVIESGRLAGWALDTGGFGFLLLVDFAAASLLSLAAIGARYLYTKFGFKGYGRASFVFLLLPFIAITGFAIINNILLLFR